MSYLETIILGIVQGIAEFLPISSSGHLVIVEAFLRQLGSAAAETGSLEDNLELNVALHFGTLMSILIVYARSLGQMIASAFRMLVNRKQATEADWRNCSLIIAIIVATLPVVFAGLFLKDQLERLFGSPIAAGCGLLVTSALLFLTPKLDRGEQPLGTITWGQALIVGLFQAVAPMPGISRSGSTIVGGLVSGLRRDAAADFSFLIAIPAILGATVLHAKDLLEQGAGETAAGPLLAGTVIAFVVGLAALKLLLRMVASRKLIWFAWYCLAMGLIVICWQLSLSA
ncbi:MAG: undecaprenyl-diphosphate phosphatase [Planctomycetaceae bacterium]|nr:undecaprenyl-diphosphate phosphatase [Planctomycetaceae bacterium]